MYVRAVTLSLPVLCGSLLLGRTLQAQEPSPQDQPGTGALADPHDAASAPTTTPGNQPASLASAASAPASAPGSETGQEPALPSSEAAPARPTPGGLPTWLAAGTGCALGTCGAVCGPGLVVPMLVVGFALAAGGIGGGFGGMGLLAVLLAEAFIVIYGTYATGVCGPGAGTVAATAAALTTDRSWRTVLLGATPGLVVGAIGATLGIVGFTLPLVAVFDDTLAPLHLEDPYSPVRVGSYIALPLVAVSGVLTVIGIWYAGLLDEAAASAPVATSP